MSSRKIFPMIKKNMIIIKRNFVKSIFQLFYPTILLFIFTRFMDVNLNNESIPEMEYYNQLEKTNLTTTDVSHKSRECIAIVGNNETSSEINLKDFSSFVQNYCILFKNKILDSKEFSQKKDFNELDLKNSNKFSSDCLVLPFDNIEKYNEYILSKEYENSTNEIDVLIEFHKSTVIKNENPIYSFRISDFFYRDVFSNEFDELNNFNIYPKEISDYNFIQNILKPKFSLIKKFILSKNNIKIDKDIQISSLPMKSPKTSKFSFAELNIVLPVTLCISYISILFQFVLWMVIEKEQKLKDLFLRQGVSIYNYFLSWFLTYLILTIPTLAINSILLKNFFFLNSNVFLIFGNLFLFSINILSSALVFHQFADNVRTGQSLLKFLYIGVSILSVPISKEGAPKFIKLIFSIFPQTLLRTSFDIFLNADVRN